MIRSGDERMSSSRHSSTETVRSSAISRKDITSSLSSSNTTLQDDQVEYEVQIVVTELNEDQEESPRRKDLVKANSLSKISTRPTRKQNGQAHNRFHHKCCDPKGQSEPRARRVTQGDNMRTKTTSERVSKNDTTDSREKAKRELSRLLSTFPDLLDQHVAENVDMDTLLRWTSAKGLNNHNLTTWKYSLEKDPRPDTLHDVVTNKDNGLVNSGMLLDELWEVVGRSLNCTSWRLVTKDSGETEVMACLDTGNVVRVSTDDMHTMYFPVEEGVLEMKRENIVFCQGDEEIVNSYLVLARAGLHWAEQYSRLKRHSTASDFLLSVVMSIFQEMISMDTLIVQIMNQAQRLVDADRASLFLLDTKTNQLYARIFDVSCESLPTDDLPYSDKEIRFPMGTGIAGYVAQTGETLNVADVEQDERFNGSVDQQTGYTTRSILCMPICIRGSVIGVVQMVNKNGGQKVFTQEDEESFRTFAVYCGLALHHAKLYDKIRRSEQKYKVALEVLSYHNSATADEVIDVQTTSNQDTQSCLALELAKFSYFATELDDMEKVKQVLIMFTDLFGTERFDPDTLVRFFTTVKKNYRVVAYHNWTHGFHVANSTYCMLKASPGTFRPLEMLAMFIGGLCHDLDHRGFNNKFMIDVGSPLATIYSTSTMEHHHFNMAVNILQQGDLNIFKKLNPEEFKQVLGNMKHCILATDLALFFPNKAQLVKLVEEEKFNWENLDHRMLVETMIMTGSDLCASAKPWKKQLDTVAVIYEEFYRQGDYERKSGRCPVPIMNRFHEDEQALHQVGFLSGICVPCYSLLCQLMPTINPMLDQCTANLTTWRRLAEEKKKEIRRNSENETKDSEP